MLDFTYLGSNILRVGEIQAEVKLYISKAARAFNFLCTSTFQNPYLSVTTKRKIYRAVLSAETWTIEVENMRMLTSFHNRCVKAIMGSPGISNRRKGLQLRG